MDLFYMFIIWFTIISLRTSHTFLQHNKNGIEIFKEKNLCNFGNWCNQQNGECCISVENVNGDLSTFLNGCIPEKCNTIIHLRIHSTELSENTLTKGWLSSFSLPVIRLSLQNCFVSELGTAVFSGVPFHLMEELNLIDLKSITSINRGTFLETNINIFSISYINFYHRLNFEANCFEGLDSVLSLQLIRCVEDHAMLHNISGRNAAILRSVQIFDLQENQLKKVEDYSFKKAPQLRSIYMHNNFLLEIEEKAFWDMPHLQSVHIKYNQLTYLPPKVFQYKNPVQGNISAHVNDWICNCDLKWFIDYALTSGVVEDLPLLKCNNGQHFSEVHLSECSDDTTINTTPKCEQSEESSSDCKTTSSTTPVQYLRSVSCSNANFEPPILAPASIEIATEIIINLIGDEEIHVTCNDFDYEDTGPANIVVDLLGRLENLYLILFLSSNNREYICHANLQERNTVKGLQRNQDYTMCLLANTGQNSLPFQCIGFKLQPEWNDRPWITNGYQALTIGIFCLALIIIMVLTSISVFFIMRQHPNLLRGNKRVIIVDTKTTDAIVMPKDYEDGLYRAPSYISEDQGYIKTKSAHSYAEVNYFKPPVLRRRNSDDCSMANVTYAVTTADGEYVVRNPLRNRSGSIPPPLPPPNSGNTIDLNYDEINKMEEYSTA